MSDKIIAVAPLSSWDRTTYGLPFLVGATKLHTYQDWTAWEHPTCGDEVPMLATRAGDSVVYHTGAYDVECFEEEVDEAFAEQMTSPPTD